jgi:hypothetical protein
MDMVRPELVRQQEEDDGDAEGLSGWARLGITLLILFVLLWQVRVPILSAMCGARWLSEDTCAVVLPSLVEAAPVAPAPAPAAAPATK